MGTFLLVEKNFTVNGYKLPSILETKTMVISQGWFCPLGNTCRYVCKHFLLSWFEAVERMVLLAFGGLRPRVCWASYSAEESPLNKPCRAWEILVRMLEEFAHVSFNLQLLETLRYYFLLKVLKIELLTTGFQNREEGCFVINIEPNHFC